jgi:hypothetical protein
MPTLYYHYTSRQAAQDIQCTGRVRSPRGFNYLSSDRYERGVDAAQALAITGKPVEIACVIPEDALRAVLGGKSIPASTPSKGITDELTGEWLRTGGGSEIEIAEPTPLNPFEWMVLNVP